MASGLLVPLKVVPALMRGRGVVLMDGGQADCSMGWTVTTSTAYYPRRSPQSPVPSPFALQAAMVFKKSGTQMQNICIMGKFSCSFWKSAFQPVEVISLQFGVSPWCHNPFPRPCHLAGPELRVLIDHTCCLPGGAACWSLPISTIFPGHMKDSVNIILK